jgi:tripartite ATP-independent transporter DctM subunit
MESAGFFMLGLVAVLLIATGLPVYVVLVGVSVLFAILGVASDAFDYSLLTALPFRIIGILETDIVQALPLYVLMGALLNRLPLANILFRAGTALFARSAAAPLLAAMGLGAMLAPMSGSVGASVATLSRIVQPRLRTRGASPARGLATVCVASTLGVVIPPSLVVILLGDAMLRAHTEAVNATGIMARVINTQDVFRGALVPAAIFLALCLALVWWTGRREARPSGAPEEPLSARDGMIAIATLLFIVGLLAAVVAGRIYPVEAAATGGLAIFVIGVASGTLRADVLRLVLRDTMAVTGALFALFVAATTFTLVVRAFETDRLIAALMAQIPGGAAGALAAVMLVIGACAFVLDAFEIIFVVIPLVMPPLLIREPDAVWVTVLTLLALQASFLIPPLGLAVMMARTVSGERLAHRAVVKALAPFLGAQVVVLGLTAALPQLAHLAGAESPPARRVAQANRPDAHVALAGQRAPQPGR